MKNIVFSLTGFVFIFPLMLFAVPKTYEVSFLGKAQAGDAFRFGIRSKQTLTYTLHVKGADKPSVRSEIIELFFTGILTFRKVNNAGNPLSLDYTIQSAAAVINGMPVDLKVLSGKTIVAKLSGPTAEFHLLPDVKTNDVQALVMGGKTPAGGKNQELTPQMKQLLSLIFRPATNESLKDTLGAGGRYSLDEQWTPSVTQLLETLHKRKIPASESDIQHVAFFEKKDRFEGIDVFAVGLNLESKNIPNYDFRLTARILIPCHESLGGPVRISRQARELLIRDLPSSEPLAAGNSIELLSTDNTDIAMVPLKALKPSEDKNTESWWRRIFH